MVSIIDAALDRYVLVQWPQHKLSLIHAWMWNKQFSSKVA